MSLRTYKIDVVTKKYGLLGPEGTGLPETVQAARLVVTNEGESRSHVVVCAASSPFVLMSSDEALHRVFPVDVVSAVRLDAAGDTTISCGEAADGERLGAAAAVATLKRAWGWDESPSIRVRFGGRSRDLLLNPVFDAGAWWVKHIDFDHGRAFDERVWSSIKTINALRSAYDELLNTLAMSVTDDHLSKTGDGVAIPLGAEYGPRFGEAPVEGTWIECRGGAFYYFHAERGVQRILEYHGSAADVLFAVFDSITQSLAATYESRHRIRGQDSRQQLFRIQEKLMRQLAPEWGDRVHVRLVELQLNDEGK